MRPDSANLSAAYFQQSPAGEKLRCVIAGCLLPLLRDLNLDLQSRQRLIDMLFAMVVQASWFAGQLPLPLRRLAN